MEPKLLKFFDNEINAIDIKVRLEEAGIKCVLHKEPKTVVNVLTDPTEDGVAVYVDKKDYAEAKAVLDSYELELENALFAENENYMDSESQVIDDPYMLNNAEYGNTDNAIIDNEQEEEYDWEAAEANEQWKQSGKQILYGLLWGVGGALVSIITYVNAATSPTGGHFIIAWGAVLYGITLIFKGLDYRLSNSKPDGDSCSEEERRAKKKKRRWLLGLVVIVAIAAIVLFNTKDNKKSNVDTQVIEQREKTALADYNKPQYIIDESLMEDGEVTNGQIIFKRPEGYMKKYPLDPELPNGYYGYHISNNKRADGWELFVSSSIADSEPTDEDLNQLTKSWAPEWTKQCKMSTIKNAVHNERIGRVFEREYKYSHAGSQDIKEEIVVIYNKQFSKVCVIAAFEAYGKSAPVKSIKESLKFYNTIKE